MRLEYRPSDPAVVSDPFPYYQRMRDEDVKRVCLDIAGMSSDRLRPFFATLPSAKAAKILRPDIEALTGWLLERLDAREEVDFIEAFARPLPAVVIMHMLGVPRAELARLKRLSDEMALFIGSAREAPDKYQRAEAATREMAALFRELIARRP